MMVLLYVVMLVLLFVIALMLQRLFNGPTIFDRMNALGVIGADTICLIVVFGFIDKRPLSVPIQFYYWYFSAILTSVRICMWILRSLTRFWDSWDPSSWRSS